MRCRIIAGQGHEIGQRQPAIGPVEQGQPGDPVAQVDQRAGERDQVHHHRAVLQRADLHRLEAQAA